MTINFSQLFKEPMKYAKLRDLSKIRIIERKKFSMAQLSRICDYLITIYQLQQVSNVENLLTYGYCKNGESVIMLPLAHSTMKQRFIMLRCVPLNPMQQFIDADVVYSIK